MPPPLILSGGCFFLRQSVPRQGSRLGNSWTLQTLDCAGAKLLLDEDCLQKCWSCLKGSQASCDFKNLHNSIRHNTHALWAQGLPRVPHRLDWIVIFGLWVLDLEMQTGFCFEAWHIVDIAGFCRHLNSRECYMYTHTHIVPSKEYSNI